MKAFKVIYQNGHFVDIETKKRIIPVQGAEYVISADSDAFNVEDFIHKERKILSSEEKLELMKSKYGTDNFKKILNSGERLFFRMGNTRRIVGDPSREFVFGCSLREDLYLYKIKGKGAAKHNHWRLAECQCILEECILGGLTLTEKVPANSLNSLFGQTKDFYFRNQRSGSCDVFNTFYIYQDGMNITFDGTKQAKYKNLDDIRKAFVKDIIVKKIEELNNL
ncbi:MAG TPA: hypothetical protein PKN32_05550 [Bacteroidales bacterium]|nr:hypothetical protein [Bacteroidales bacterium]